MHNATHNEWTWAQTEDGEVNAQIAAWWDCCLVICCVWGTVACDLLSLVLRVLGAVGLERRKSPQLLETTEERLLLLLRVGCQNLLGQAQFLVGLPLLAGRWYSRQSSACVMAGVSRLSGSGDVLYDFCVDDSGKNTLAHAGSGRNIFFYSTSDDYSVSIERMALSLINKAIGLLYFVLRN